MTNMPIVVGTDGSPHAQAAVDVAAYEAAVRKAPLKLIFTFPPRYSRFDVGESGIAQPIIDGCLRVLENEKARVLERHDDLEIETAFFEQAAAEALVEASSEADLVVVGARGMGAIRRLFVGSVSRAVASDAHCPVLIVRKGADSVDGSIVVGLGPDEGASEVLDCGLQFARAHGVPLKAIHGRQHAGANVYDIEIEAYREAVTQRMAAVDEQTKQRFDEVAAAYSDVDATFEASSDHAVDALLEAGEDAALIVIGRCAKDKKNQHVLGSVAEGVLAEAARVVVVPMSA